LGSFAIDGISKEARVALCDLPPAMTLSSLSLIAGKAGYVFHDMYLLRLSAPVSVQTAPPMVCFSSTAMVWISW
jgi:hypothetical protein